METIAVYWEAIVRIYGFTVRTDLALFLFRIGAAVWNVPAAAADATAKEVRFVAALGQCMEGTVHEHAIVTTADQAGPMRAFIEKRFGKIAVENLTVTAPVDAISFQGPHFGDRYGILDTTFGAVDRAGVPMLASGFSSSTVFMIFPGGTAARVQSRLAEVFTVPKGP